MTRSKTFDLFNRLQQLHAEMADIYRQLATAQMSLPDEQKAAIDKFGPKLIDDVLELTTRPRNVLHEAGIHCISELALLSETELLKLPGMGRHSVQEINDMMTSLGLPLPKYPGQTR